MQMAAETGINLAVSMDVDGAIGDEREFLAGSHFDQVKAAMRAVHDFGEQTEHHRAATFGDHHIV